MTADMDIAACSRALREAAARTAALLRTAPDGDAPVPGLAWNVAETAAHLFMTVPVMMAAMLGDLLIHGLDIARAVGRRWPIAREDALLVIGGIMAMVPEYLDRQRTAGLHVAYELRFRGGPRYRLTVDNGAAAVSAPDRKADCWISADPVAFLLVGYGSVGQWGQTLRGKIVAGGRKPWLGLKIR